MANDKSKTGRADRARISVNEGLRASVLDCEVRLRDDGVQGRRRSGGRDSRKGRGPYVRRSDRSDDASLTRYFHEMAFIIGWLAFLMVVSAIVAALVARKWGRTKQARQAIYSVVRLVELTIFTAITTGRLRGVRFTP
jgi:hypothetical protein